MRLLFITDAPHLLKRGKDSTLALVRAARARGDEVYCAEMATLSLCGGGAVPLCNGSVRVRATQVCGDVDEDGSGLRFAPESEDLSVAEKFDAVVIRKNPPMNKNLITATRLLDIAAQHIPVINAPQALRDMGDKLSIFKYPDLIPPSWVGNDVAGAREFSRAFERVVMKPLTGLGGQGVYVSQADDPNFASVFELLNKLMKSEDRKVMLQEYLPAVRQGDCRVFAVNGEIMPKMLARLPAVDDHRGNMTAGAAGEARDLDAETRAVSEAVAPALARAGIRFAGLDIIGGRLVEINIICPGGIGHINAQLDKDISPEILERMTDFG